MDYATYRDRLLMAERPDIIALADALAEAVEHIWPSWFKPEVTDHLVAQDWEGAWQDGLALIKAARAYRAVRSPASTLTA